MISTRKAHRTEVRSQRSRFDIGHSEWALVEEAVQQRIEAVELFLADLSGRFRFADQLNPADPAIDLIARYRRQLSFALPSFSKRIWLAAMDLVADTAGQLWFVDDHFSCPQGLHRLYQTISKTRNDADEIASWHHFTLTARSLIPAPDRASSVVLGSAIFNTSYADNRFFAEWLDLPYVSQRQLQLTPTELVRQTHGTTSRVTKVFRRLQDTDLDPNCFDPNSLQGVRGLVKAANRGILTVVNAAGVGLFNDRLISRLIPDLIRFFLDREPILPTVSTAPLDSRQVSPQAKMHSHVFRTSNSMDVLKPLVGPASPREKADRYLRAAAQNPSRYVARQTIDSLTDGRAEAASSIRVFCAGKSKRVVMRGGLKRACHCDGTPISPVTHDTTVGPLRVSRPSAT